MQRHPFPRLASAALTAALLATAVLCAAQIQPQDRILQPIDEDHVSRLQGNVHPMARAEFDRGRLNPGVELQGVSLNFRLSASQQTALEKLLADQQTPRSPNYHKWLTPEQYGARFGMSQGDLDRVKTWLESAGFTNIHVSRSRTRISFSGTAARVEAAMHTELHNYEVNGEMHFANATEPSLPAAIAPSVMAVQHLTDFRPQPRAHVVPAAHFTSAVSGNHFLTPGDFATIYDIKPLYDAGTDGTGVTIVVTGQTQIDVSHVNTFRSASGLSSNTPTTRLTPNTGGAATLTSDLDEAYLDVEWSGGVAKGATVLYDFAGASGNVFDALTDAIDNNLGPVISISYGNCESQIGSPTVVQSLRTLVQQGSSQGQTLSAASGDAGAADCEGANSTTSTTGLAVDVPAAIPEVTGVGGSEFTGDPSSTAATQYWNATGSSDDISSAVGPIPEMVWNDTGAAGTLSASGGGVSTIFAKPAWQTALTLADGKRDVPDISLNGSNGHDPYLFCSVTDSSQLPACTSGFRDSGGNLDAVGGTSVGSQVFAGIVAILNQATESRLGNINPTLYTLAASTPAAFHDITSGNNMVPCTSGTTNCPSGTTQIGYSATTGYDLATGLGSIDVNALAMAWPGFVVAPSYTVSGSAVTISAPGGSGTSTITVSSSTGFSGTVNLSCALTPPSTTAQVSCAFTAPTAGATTSVSLSGSSTSATATLSVATVAAHAVKVNSADARHSFRWFTGLGTLAAGIFLIPLPGRRRRWMGLTGLLFCVFLAAGAGCGGGSSSGSTNSQSSPGTPTGNYVITVTASSGSISHSSNVAVSVQ